MNPCPVFGTTLRLFVRGASHASALRFSLDGFPRYQRVDLAQLTAFMERRAPGRDKLSTTRRESDAVEFLSGIVDGVTDGKVIRGIIRNADARPGDYGVGRTIPRPGHADFPQWVESGRIPTGGGANSGRLTALLCAVGALCLQYLARRGVTVSAEIVAVNGKSSGFEREIEKARKDGDSVGGIVRCTVDGLPAGLGGALFGGLESALSSAIFAIPGVKGIGFGDGFACASQRGSKFNDAFAIKDGKVVTTSNRQGGILGGRTNGMSVVFDVAFRPTPTVFKPQCSVDLATMTPAECLSKGRHDPCIVRRAVPVVEALAAFAVTDLILTDEAARPRVCLVLDRPTLEEDLALYASQRYFADMVELRVDFLKKSELGKVAAFPSMLPPFVRSILTYRRKCDGGQFDGSDEERKKFFKCVFVGSLRQGEDALATLPWRESVARASSPWQHKESTELSSARRFDFVDFEDDFRDHSLTELARSSSVAIIRSLHSFNAPPKNLAATLRRMVAHTGEIAKIAFLPRSLRDVSRILSEKFCDANLPPHVICAMGAMGFASRALAVRTGSLWTYASVPGARTPRLQSSCNVAWASSSRFQSPCNVAGASSPRFQLGHVSPYELVTTYRLRTVTTHAALFGVTGFPLAATRSPEINNAAFADEDLDAVMVPFPAKSAREALAFMKATVMSGMAVTIPHKQTIMPLLDRIDRYALKVGAVNTVVFENGRYVGYNTDVAGFSEAITAFAGELKGRSVAVLGDGGAAQAVKVALRELGAKYQVFHRATPSQGYDIIVNATPVDPIPDYVFTGRELVYDLRYVPAETPLMARARAAGCRVENGFSMLCAQAREQRRLWFKHIDNENRAAGPFATRINVHFAT